jgi:hypothetical protein
MKVKDLLALLEAQDPEANVYLALRMHGPERARANARRGAAGARVAREAAYCAAASARSQRAATSAGTARSPSA